MSSSNSGKHHRYRAGLLRQVTLLLVFVCVVIAGYLRLRLVIVDDSRVRKPDVVERHYQRDVEPPQPSSSVTDLGPTFAIDTFFRTRPDLIATNFSARRIVQLVPRDSISEEQRECVEMLKAANPEYEHLLFSFRTARRYLTEIGAGDLAAFLEESVDEEQQLAAFCAVYLHRHGGACVRISYCGKLPAELVHNASCAVVTEDDSAAFIAAAASAPGHSSALKCASTLLVNPAVALFGGMTSFWDHSCIVPTNTSIRLSLHRRRPQQAPVGAALRSAPIDSSGIELIKNALAATRAGHKSAPDQSALLLLLPSLGSRAGNNLPFAWPESRIPLVVVQMTELDEVPVVVHHKMGALRKANPFMSFHHFSLNTARSWLVVESGPRVTALFDALRGFESKRLLFSLSFLFLRGGWALDENLEPAAAFLHTLAPTRGGSGGAFVKLVSRRSRRHRVPLLFGSTVGHPVVGRLIGRLSALADQDFASLSAAIEEEVRLGHDGVAAVHVDGSGEGCLKVANREVSVVPALQFECMPR